MFVLKNPVDFHRMPEMACGPHAACWALGSIGKEWPYDKNLEHKPVLPHKMVEIISAVGVYAEATSLLGHHDETKVEMLKSMVYKGRPVPIMIKSRYIPHWVVVAGFDEKGFYLFDSDFPDDPKMPVGNRHISKAELLKRWSMPWWGQIFPQWKFVLINVVPE